MRLPVMDALIRSRSREILPMEEGDPGHTANGQNLQTQISTSGKQMLMAVHSCRANPAHGAEEVNQFNQAPAGRGGRNNNPVQLG
jgi:hypothetical protein